MARPHGPSTKVYDLRERPDKASPYIVAWKYRGKSTQRSFRHKREAERAMYKLIDLIDNGARFNAATGWPVEWEMTAELTIAAAAHTWFWQNAKTWEPHTRRSNAEPLANFIIEATRPNPSAFPPSGKTTSRRGIVTEVSPRSGMRLRVLDWLSQEPSSAVMPEWVVRNSLPLAELTSVVCARVSSVITMKDDGSGPKAASTQARFRTNITAFLDWCIAQGHLAGPNPWPAHVRNRKRTKKSRQDNAEVRTKLLPTGAEVSEVITSLIKSTRPGRAARGIALGLEYYGGLRPGEAVALTIENCELPATGWGTITVDAARTATSKRWTKTGEEQGPPKTAPRVTTIPPVFVKQLRKFIGDRTTGLVAPNERGGMLDVANVNRAFAEACQEKLGKKWRQYDLRAARASLHANSGRAHAQVAREMGHSVTILQEVYLGTSTADLTRGLDVVEKRLKSRATATKKTAPAKKAVAKKSAAKKAAPTAKRTQRKTAAKKTARR